MTSESIVAGPGCGSAALNAAVSSDQCDGAERRRTGQLCATRATAEPGKPISVSAKVELNRILPLSGEPVETPVWFIFKQY